MSGRTISVVSKRRGYKVSTGLIVNKLRIFYIFLLMSDCWGKKLLWGEVCMHQKYIIKYTLLFTHNALHKISLLKLYRAGIHSRLSYVKNRTYSYFLLIATCSM